MEIRHMRLVKELAESGTLTAAGKKLALSQPALSRQLRALEGELGVCLFHRSGRRLILTQAGTRLHQGICRTLQELENTINSMKIFADGRGGVLRLAIACYTCYHWLPDLLTIYRKEYPGVEISINLGATADPVEALRKGELDVGLMNRIVAGSDLDYQTVFVDEDIIVVPKEHSWAKRKYIRSDELAGENLIVFDSDLKESNLFRKVLNPAMVSPKNIIKLPMTEAIINMVKSGLGISVMVRWAAAPYLDSPDLIPLRLTRKGIRRTWYAVTLREDPRPAYIQRFIELLKKVHV